MAISWTNNDMTITMNMTSSLGTVYATGASTSITIPTTQMKITGSYVAFPVYLGIGQAYDDYGSTPKWTTNTSGGIKLKYGSTTKKAIQGHTGKISAKNTYANLSYVSSTATLTTSDYFKSTNASTKSVTLNFVVESGQGIEVAEYSYGGHPSFSTTSTQTLGSFTLTLNAPPIATVSQVSFDTPYVYAGMTTASVTVSGSTAYYGGTVSSVKLTIGNQSASISGNGTISIPLNAGGTFTPTVTVTDSRGQTKTYSLNPITVKTYTAPSVSFDVDRTDSSGQPDDEGTYGLMEATFTFTDAIATALAPSVVLTDQNGTQTTPTVTWYTDDTLTTTVTWSSLSSGDTVYGMFSGINTQYSYQVSVRPRDTEGTGTAIVQTISSAFYTVDFLAGGHGIAFGQAALQEGFWCNMDVYIGIPDYQDTGTTDKAIYDALVALGWDSDVIV